MATPAVDAVPIPRPSGSLTKFADRWIYVFMAAFYFAIALGGFLPSSFTVLNAVAAGQRPPLPPVLHFHAVMMATWMSLLLLQTTLVATGNRALHMKLGLASFVVAPLVVAGMIGIVNETYSMLATMAPGVMSAEALSNRRFAFSNLLLEQIRIVVIFSVFVAWAIVIRRKDSETHKRLIFFATLMPLPAAFNRIPWLPSTLPDSPLSNHLLLLVCLSPLLIYDFWRRGRVHNAYLTGIAACLPFMAVAYLFWSTDWWLATAPRIFGIDSW